MNIEPCPFCEEEVRLDLGDLSAKCVSCFYTGPTDDNEAAAHNRLSRIVRAAEALSKVLPEKWQQDILIRWLDGYDNIKGTTSKEIQTVMGELFRKASAIKTVEGGDNA